MKFDYWTPFLLSVGRAAGLLVCLPGVMLWGCLPLRTPQDAAGCNLRLKLYPWGGGVLEECQTGFDVVLEGWDNTNNTGNFMLPVEAVLAELGLELSGDRVLRLEAQGRGAREGEELELSFRLRGFEGLAAVQAGLQFDAQRLRFEGLGTLSRWVRSYDFGLSEASQGRIRWLWVSPDGENAELPPEEVLFTLRFRVLEGTAEGATAVRLSDAVLPCVAYDAAGGAYRVQGGAGVLSQRASSGTALPGSFRLRALPNPFRSGLRLEVWMPQAGRFRIRVLDAAGRTVQELERRLPAGRHELELEDSDRWPAGVYWYRVEAPERLAGKWVKQR